MNKNMSKVDQCRCCGNLNLSETLSLANNIKLMTCTFCFHNQWNMISADSNLLFTSDTIEGADFFAELIRQDNPEAKSVLYIGCNDISQANALNQKGFETFNIINGEWTQATTKEFGTPFDLVISQYVIDKVHNVVDFLINCKSVLSDKGRIYIQIMSPALFVNEMYDRLDDDRASIFNTLSMSCALSQAGLCLQDVMRTSTNGGDYIYVIGHVFEIEKAKALIDADRQLGLYDIITYQNYRNTFQK